MNTAFKPFVLGQIAATPGALLELSQVRILEILHRHLSGDFGEVCREDWDANLQATHDGSRILSVYWIDEQNHSKGKVWCITDCAYAEAEGEEETRHVTTLLLPDEY
jgi:hypothetical protein